MIDAIYISKRINSIKNSLNNLMYINSIFKNKLIKIMKIMNKLEKKNFN